MIIYVYYTACIPVLKEAPLYPFPPHLHRFQQPTASQLLRQKAGVEGKRHPSDSNPPSTVFTSSSSAHKTSSTNAAALSSRNTERLQPSSSTGEKASIISSSKAATDSSTSSRPPPPPPSTSTLTAQGTASIRAAAASSSQHHRGGSSVTTGGRGVGRGEAGSRLDLGAARRTILANITPSTSDRARGGNSNRRRGGRNSRNSRSGFSYSQQLASGLIEFELLFTLRLALSQFSMPSFTVPIPPPHRLSRGTVGCLRQSPGQTLQGEELTYS